MMLGVGAALVAAPTVASASSSGLHVTWEWVAVTAVGVVITLGAAYFKGIVSEQKEKISELQRETKSNSTAIVAVRELLISDYQRSSKVDQMFERLTEAMADTHEQLAKMQQQLDTIQSERKSRG